MTALDGTVVPARATHRRTWRIRLRTSLVRLRAHFGRLRRKAAAVRAALFPPRQPTVPDWSKTELEQLAERKALPPAMDRPAGRAPGEFDPSSSARNIPLPPQPAPQSQSPRPHPPFAMQRPANMHTLDWMMHLLTDLRANPNLTVAMAVEVLQGPNRELNEMFLREQAEAREAAEQAATVARRSARNAQAAAEAARGLEMALQTPGVSVETAASSGGEFVPALGERMVAAASHASDTSTQTGVMPLIAEDMPDPRLVGHDPLDVESAESPVHEPSTGTIPAVPAQRPASDALPHREPVADPEGMSPPLPPSTVPSHPFLTEPDEDTVDDAEVPADTDAKSGVAQ